MAEILFGLSKMLMSIFLKILLKGISVFTYENKLALRVKRKIVVKIIPDREELT